MNCPFYSHHLVVNFGQHRFVLINSNGNQCAIVEHLAPCKMELEQKSPDWKECAVFDAVRIHRPGSGPARKL